MTNDHSTRNYSILSPENDPLVSVIVLNFNGQQVLADCLDSIYKSSYSPFEVIVVDNGSQDDSGKIAFYRHKCRLLRNKYNIGFCAGHNAGIRSARGEFLVLLNNDITVHPDWLSQLVSAGKKGADFCQPKILLDDRRTINATGLDIHFMGFGMPRGLGEIDKGQYDGSIFLSGFNGTCIFASKEAIEKVGLLDETFYSFNEDTDWSWKALLKDLKITYVPSALVYHKWGHSYALKSPVKFRLLERNRLIMILTNYSCRTICLLSPILIITEFASFGYCIQNSFLSAKVKSYADLLLLRNYLMKRRRFIQKTRRVPDRLLLKRFKFNLRQKSLLSSAADPVNAIYFIFWRFISRFF
jgi:GT2 family glycosyltransferase